MHPPRVVTAEHREHEANILTDILKSAKYIDRNRNCVTGPKRDVARIAVLAPEKTPGPLMNDEHFFATVAVQRVGTAGWLSRAADIKAMGLADMHVLIGIFSDAGADDGEIFFFVAAGAARVDEGIGTRPQFGVANHL